MYHIAGEKDFKVGKIVCLMGKSCSGKDTVFKLLKDDKDLNLKAVVTYTTRPKRDNETDGAEYFFVDEKKLNSFGSRIIEKRTYNTVCGLWHYATVDDGQIDLKSGNYIMIVTLESFQKIKYYFGENNIIPVYIDLDDGIRLERALNRERQQKKPDYNEMCRRFLADNEDFSAEKIEQSGIKKFYINTVLKDCFNSIKEDVLEALR